MDYHPDTPAIVLVQLAEDVSKIQSLQSHVAMIPTYSEKYKVAQKIVSTSAMLRPVMLGLKMFYGSVLKIH